LSGLLSLAFSLWAFPHAFVARVIFLSLSLSLSLWS
jgi:hypothetical protein